MADCFNCGHELVWQNDWMKSELEGFEYDEDDDQIVNVLECPHCHAEVLVYHPSNNMLKEYKEDDKS